MRFLPLLLFLTGCTPTYGPFNIASWNGDVRIVALPNVESRCGKGNVACATLPPNPCVIYVGHVTTHEILGHELRHCLQGAFHP